ncbi:MAG TPA: hypothetical protein VGB66_04395 [Longimicrobium sp.]
MANLTETPVWETGVYQWENTDPIEGGANGIDNVPTRQLANRTSFLRQVLAVPYAVGDLLYATGANALAKLPIGAANRVLTSSGTGPQWSLLGAAREVQIPICSSRDPWTTSSTVMVDLPGRHEFAVDVSQYPGTTSFFLEVVGEATSGATFGSQYLELYSVTDAAAVATSGVQIIYNEGSGLRKRTAAFTLTGNKVYRVRHRTDDSTAVGKLFAARLIVRVTP